MAEDIQVFVVESDSDFVASITVDDNNVADTNLTGDGVGDLIVQFIDSAAGVGGSVSNFRDLSDVDSTNISSSGAGDKFVLTFDASNNKFVFVNPDAVIDAAVGAGTTFPAPVGLSTEAVQYLDDELDNKIDLDAGTF
tara:strand:- start:4976 stop:5389 length:414 start_codon:yes stop_codon:yes gene_type:complete